jgi:CheY-like chemotaxis protein
MKIESSLANWHGSISTKDRRTLRVLVVDDYPDNAESMAMLLRIHGYEVEAAQSGFAALALARARRPHAVLLDICMPGMDGFKVARQLRAMFPDQPPLLIAITARGFEEDHQRYLDAGFDVHLVKPADPDAVQRLLANGTS